MLRSILFVAAAALAVPALAQAPDAAKADAEEKVKDPNRKICEKVEKIGSRLNFVTVCLTADQWKTVRANHRHDFESVQRIVNQSPSN